MKTTYIKSREGYRPSITQRIDQFFRCLRNEHIWIVYDIVENAEIIGELKKCEHCGESISSFNL